MQSEAKARYLQMLHQSVALSSKAMLREAVNARWFWTQVYLHCLLAAEMDQPVHFSSRIDGVLLPNGAWWSS